MQKFALTFALLSGASLTHPSSALAQETTAGAPPLVQAQDPTQPAEPDQTAAPPPIDQPGPAPGGGSLPDPSAPGDQPLASVETPPVVTVGPLSAWGDTFEAANLVRTRPRPGLDPSGLPIGSFTLYPAIEASIGYDDNVFATSRNKVQSATFTLAPSLL
ncbi:MAG TPA: outer membrane beta-barrel protein, partial [Oscillatoriaceae cyanobacterium]